jgi:hypothetical protein
MKRRSDFTPLNNIFFFKASNPQKKRNSRKKDFIFFNGFASSLYLPEQLTEAKYSPVMWG